MRLYFFPALLPLTGLLPGLLSAVGALAAVTQMLRKKKLTPLLWAILGLLGIGILASLFYQQHKTAVPQSDSMTLVPRAPLSNPVWDKARGLLIYGTAQSSIDFYSPKERQVVHTIPTKEPVFAEPLIDHDDLYVGEGLHSAPKASLTKISLSTLKPIWNHEFASHLESSPALSPNQSRLYGCAGAAGVYSIDSKTGALLWQSSLGHCDSTPLIQDHKLWVLTSDPANPHSSLLSSLDLETGQPDSPAIRLPGHPWGTVLWDPISRYLLFTTGTGDLSPQVDPSARGWSHAVNLQSRQIAWTQPLSSMPLTRSLLVTLQKQPRRALSINVTKMGLITAFETHSGELAWKLQLPGPTLAEMQTLRAGLRVLALTYDGKLVEIESESGRILGEQTVAQESSSAPLALQTRLLVATRSSIWNLAQPPLRKTP